MHKMKMLFSNAHAIVKQARPLTDYVWMCSLDEKKGLNIGKTYRNNKACSVFVKYIAKAERDQLSTTLQKATFYSIMVDGSTDRSVKEEELVYVRVFKAGKVEVHFVGIEAVEKADAAHVTQAVRTQMKTLCSDWETRLVAVATGGASVMTGERSGVVTRLRGDRAYILGVHCMAHREELAYSDAIKKCSMYQKAEDLLLGLYTFYHTSPLNRSNLINCFKLRNEKPLMPTRIGGTRWVGHVHRAVDHFLRGYGALVLHLEQIQSPDSDGVLGPANNKAKKFYTSAKDSSLLKFMGFLFDVLSNMKSLSASLQSSTITLPDAHTSVVATQALLEKYETRPGPMMQATSGPSFKGVKLERNQRNDKAFKASEVSLLKTIRETLTKRFEDRSAGVVAATKVASFKNWPEKAAADFGDQEIECVCQHFGPVLISAGVNVDNIPDQWTLLKARIYSEGQSVGQLTWTGINRRHSEPCPDILKLMDLILTIPASSADCERGFSTMKQVKSDWRARLEPPRLSDLLMIQLNSKEIDDYDLSTAIGLWHTDTIHGRSRRPEFMDGGKRKHKCTVELSDSEDSDSGVVELSDSEAD